MRRFLISGIIFILAVTGAMAQEGRPLELPLELSPGISNDSATALLMSRGAKLVMNRENNYDIDFSYADTPIKRIILVFLKSKLLSVSMFSNRTPNRELHVARIRKTFEYIKDNYDCQIVEEKILSDGFLSELDDGIELASFSSTNFSLFLSSEFEPDDGYLLNIHIYSLPLILPPTSK